MLRESEIKTWKLLWKAMLNLYCVWYIVFQLRFIVWCILNILIVYLAFNLATPTFNCCNVFCDNIMKYTFFMYIYNP